MDAKKIQIELLKALRGNRTQGEVSQRLGAKFNIVYKWESGRAKISWTDFVKLCKVCKVDLQNALIKSIRFHEDPRRADLLVKFLGSAKEINESAKLLKVSRFTYSDWLNGKRIPPFDQIIKMLDTFSAASEFVGYLTPIENIPSLYQAHKNQQRKLRALEETPLIFAAKLILELDEYRKMKSHKDGYLTRKLGVTLQEEKQILQKLLELGIIEFRENLYVSTENTFVSTLSTWNEHKKNVDFWTRYGLDVLTKIESPPEGQHFNFLLLTVSSSTREKILEAYREFFFRMRALYSEDENPKEDVLMLTTQFLSLGFNQTKKNGSGKT